MNLPVGGGSAPVVGPTADGHHGHRTALDDVFCDAAEVEPLAATSSRPHHHHVCLDRLGVGRDGGLGGSLAERGRHRAVERIADAADRTVTTTVSNMSPDAPAAV